MDTAKLEQKIKDSVVEGKLPCATAFQIAREFKVAPQEVGKACNRLGIKICACQLGCFP